MSTTSLRRLLTAPRPVDRQAARVAFFRGEEFVPAHRATGLRRKTWRAPPVVVGVPAEWEPNWTGKRCGRMTAVYWYAPSRSERPSLWVCRCDCGNYEQRRPENWEAQVQERWRGNDGCESCKDSDFACGKVARMRPSDASRKARSDKWLNRMIALGLTEDEIIAIKHGNVDTHGLSAAEIRAQLVAREASV